MCRTANVFLLQRPIGSTSGNARDFRNGETRADVKFVHVKQVDEGNSRHSDRNIRETCTIIGHCKNNWAAQFKLGDFSTCVAPRPGRTITVTTPETADKICKIFLEERQISAQSKAEHLGITRRRVGSIVHEDLDMRKLSAKCVPKCMKADQKRQRCQSSEQHLDFFSAGTIKMISCRLVTMDEIWLYHYDPETEQQSME